MEDQARIEWRKSSLSTTNGCVEVAFVEGQVGVRDSKDRQGPMLMFTAHEWEAFLAGASEGQFDLVPDPERCTTA